MKQEELKMEIVVTLSEKSVDDIANVVGHQILNNMEMLLKPIDKELRETNIVASLIKSNTDKNLFTK